MEEKNIPITVDKSHLITIGQRLYAESIELIRELVNNAYDADATEVKIFLKDDEIIVEDNGTGMDETGLKQFFNIGSTLKKENPVTPKFQRRRIGEFGIGKFAVLSACDYFEIISFKNGKSYQVIFDKEEWERDNERWHLPLKITSPFEKKEGTKVILKKLRKKFSPEIVERRLQESVPLGAPHFNVFLNDKKIRAKYIAGRKIPFLEGTKFGLIHGEIIIAPLSEIKLDEAGVEIKVKQVTIRKATPEEIGLMDLGKDLARIYGEINADFLPITSDRTNFLLDSEEYSVFKQILQTLGKRIKDELRNIADKKENIKASRTLKEVISRIEKALLLNPDFAPEGTIPVGEGGKGDILAKKSGEKARTEISEKKEIPLKKEKKKKRRKRPKVTLLTPQAMVKHYRIGNMGISIHFDHFGKDAPEIITRGNLIEINRDHPLYQKEKENPKTYARYLARIITQEIILKTNPSTPRQAFLRQAKLLKDAFVE
ncbi:MAG: ATP-binding protein [Elusimicrobia bacterium]|nr:ATP-binding protein [Elusimicrobiota bacterium]